MTLKSVLLTEVATVDTLFSVGMPIAKFNSLPLVPAYRVTKKVDTLKQALVNAMDDVVDEIIEKVPRVGALLKIADNYIFNKINNSLVTYGITFDITSQWSILCKAAWIMEAPSLFSYQSRMNAADLLNSVNWPKTLHKIEVTPVKLSAYEQVMIMDIVFIYYKYKYIYGRSAI